jgi:hypothetical protein
MMISDPTGPAHHVHRLIQRQAQHGFAVHMGDEVARLDAGAAAAGVSSIGETTLTKPSSCVTSIPKARRIRRGSARACRRNRRAPDSWNAGQAR